MHTIIKDNEALYFLLEECDVLFSDFTIDQVLAFAKEDDFYLVFYLAAGRNFIAFKGAGFVQEKDVLPGLLAFVQESQVTEISPDLLNRGIRLIENKIHSKDNSHFYFDAH